MKTITFEGRQYEVEDWVNWVARDYDGDIVSFELMPKIDTFRDFWAGSQKGRFKILYEPQNSWQDSLTKV